MTWILLCICKVCNSWKFVICARLHLLTGALQDYNYFRSCLARVIKRSLHLALWILKDSLCLHHMVVKRVCEWAAYKQPLASFLKGYLLNHLSNACLSHLAMACWCLGFAMSPQSLYIFLFYSILALQWLALKVYSYIFCVRVLRMVVFLQGYICLQASKFPTVKAFSTWNVYYCGLLHAHNYMY